LIDIPQYASVYPGIQDKLNTVGCGFCFGKVTIYGPGYGTAVP